MTYTITCFLIFFAYFLLHFAEAVAFSSEATEALEALEAQTLET